MLARSAAGLRGLSTVHPWTDAKLVRIPANHPAGFSFTRPPLQRGPGRATRILRVLLEEPDQEQNKSKAAAERRFALDAAFQLLSFSPSAGHDGPLLYPGPLCGGELGTTGPQGHRQGCRCLFARTGVLSKSPAPAHGLAGQDARQAPSGVAFLFSLVTFSLATQRESNSGATGARKLLPQRH